MTLHHSSQQDRTTRGKLFLILAMLILAIDAVASFAIANEPPNIVLILADDMGYSDLGCYGSEIDTPHLDQLAARGVRFTQFYNAAKCEPTRASLMSGRYWQDAGFGVKRGQTIGEVMKKAGYATFAVGKWHLDGNPVDRGFDHYFGHLSGGSHYFKVGPSQRLDREVYKQPPGDFYMTDANADHAVKFIDEHHSQKPDTPYFMYLAFNAPHSPLHALPEDIAKYRETYQVGWDKIRESRYQKQVESGITRGNWRLSSREASVPAWDAMRIDEREYEATRMAIYAAMVDRMDQAIGRVLTKIREIGDEENTLVVFLSDNGGSPSDVTNARRTPEALLGPSGAGIVVFGGGGGWPNASNTPFHSHKVEMGNGGVITSCIASWPAVVTQPGSINDEPSHIIDLMATCMDVGGAKPEASVDRKKGSAYPGKSLRLLLGGQMRDSHEALYFHLYHNRAIVSGKWKLTSDWDRPWQLFDLSADRTELADVSGQYPDLAARLQKQWDDWYAKVPEKRFSPGTGDLLYRRLDDNEESYLSRASDGNNTELGWLSEAQ